MTGTVLITGAAGGLGSETARFLAAAGFRLRLLDVRQPVDPPAGAELLLGSVTDAELVGRGCAGADAVLHFGGIRREHEWEQILSVNVDGTRTVLEAAQQHGVGKVYLASSNHAVGFWRAEEAPASGLPADCPARPDTFYGVSKVAVEALGATYHHRFGTDVLAVRIGSCLPDPEDERALTTWFSPSDHEAMVLAWLADPTATFRLIWGVSANQRGWFDLSSPTIPGYTSRSDAERDLPELAAAHPRPTSPPSDPVANRLGGWFTTVPLGEPMDPPLTTG